LALKAYFKIALCGPNLEGLFCNLADRGLFGRDPLKVSVDQVKLPITPNWIKDCLSKNYQDVMVRFDRFYNFISIDYEIIVMLGITDYSIDPHATLDLLSPLNFELFSCEPLFDEWYNGDLGEEYIPPGFADMHRPHGWACAFKGAGHDRLVSRRWLDYGPWRVLRGPDDTTLVQFHDVSDGVDARTALEQARPGHQRMGISRTGGFIQTGFNYGYDLKGFYDANERLLKIVVHGREVTQHEMLDACAARHYNVLGPDKPLDNVAFVFMAESAAREHLHEMWLRELECRAIIDGKEVILNTDYNPPPPEKPQWVKDLEAQESVSGLE
jgi:hypothetical protein